jgi:hypothetical protein
MDPVLVKRAGVPWVGELSQVGGLSHIEVSKGFRALKEA